MIILIIATWWTDKNSRLTFFQTFKLTQKYVGIRDETRDMNRDGFVDTKTPKDNIVRTLKTMMGRQELAPAVKEDLNRCINILIKTENLNVVDYSAVKRVNKRGSKSAHIGEEWIGLALEARRFVHSAAHDRKVHKNRILNPCQHILLILVICHQGSSRKLFACRRSQAVLHTPSCDFRDHVRDHQPM